VIDIPAGPAIRWRCRSVLGFLVASTLDCGDGPACRRAIGVEPEFVGPSDQVAAEGRLGNAERAISWSIPRPGVSPDYTFVPGRAAEDSTWLVHFRVPPAATSARTVLFEQSPARTGLLVNGGPTPRRVAEGVDQMKLIRIERPKVRRRRRWPEVLPRDPGVLRAKARGRCGSLGEEVAGK
jgi:hypothetical protein